MKVVSSLLDAMTRIGDEALVPGMRVIGVLALSLLDTEFEPLFCLHLQSSSLYLFLIFFVQSWLSSQT